MSTLYGDTPLGRKTDYIDQYTPSLLCPVPRWDSREALDLEEMPFKGIDIWNAYEVSYLDAHGKPVVLMAELRVPCTSRNLVESKSLKLYLNSFANTRFESRQHVRQTMENDLSACAEGPVDVKLIPLEDAALAGWLDIKGMCIDHQNIELETLQYDPTLLQVDQGAESTDTVYSHLLRSCCPVTGQPDWATVIVRYTGQPISTVSLLRYIAGFRNHQGFHEQVIEQVYVDILQQCQPRHLTVYGRFTRRGGIDINPFRTNFEEPWPNLRVVRQ